ncbi:hypothetical protein [Noviherbaspirillum saxi]|uniref:Uncharacterized protein n=1 Tax=Noviherbaspirillum saxi TaxID=2320863 RepID=A0A3A3FSN1_9BURK|nr:hypothetical protein [Noviherbaspirillum saxi]RJF99056.1 hypothetical protein D3871_11430 [Noviherbaspirillum saxi]
MKQDQLLKMMTVEDALPAVENWDELLKFYAEHLARISGRLTENELYPLIAVGGMIFQRKLEDVRNGSNVDGLFQAMMAKRATEKI